MECPDGTSAAKTTGMIAACRNALFQGVGKMPRFASLVEQEKNT